MMQALEKIDANCVDLLGKLGIIDQQQPSGEKQSSEPPPRSILPERLVKLFGGGKELRDLEEALVEDGTMVALMGRAGMGKSHLANYFAYKWLEEDEKNRFCLWISAETGETVQEGYRQILSRLKVPFNTAKVDFLSNLVWKTLRGANDSWMVVFDNIPEVRDGNDGPEVFKPWFFPVPLGIWGPGRILLTTRHTCFVGATILGHITPVVVDKLRADDAVKMMLAYIEIPKELRGESQEVAMDHVGTSFFDGFPFAISIASDLIKDRKYSDESKMMDEVIAKVQCSIAVTLDYVRLNSGTAFALKKAAASEKRDRIPLEVLIGDKKATKADVQLLCKLNLLRLVQRDTYSIHRLHQLAANDETQSSELQPSSFLPERLAKLLSREKELRKLKLLGDNRTMTALKDTNGRKRMITTRKHFPCGGMCLERMPMMLDWPLPSLISEVCTIGKGSTSQLWGITRKQLPWRDIILEQMPDMLARPLSSSIAEGRTSQLWRSTR